MGISTHYYTIYGVRVESYDDKLSDEMYGNDDKYQVIEECEDLDVIMDDMGGDYMIFGKILFDSGDLRWSGVKDTYVEVDIEKLSFYKKLATYAMEKHLPNFTHYIDTDWKIMTIMHLS